MLHFCFFFPAFMFRVPEILDVFSLLQELMAYIERNPEAYGKVLQRRKQDEQEEAGVMSYLKVWEFLN